MASLLFRSSIRLSTTSVSTCARALSSRAPPASDKPAETAARSPRSADDTAVKLVRWARYGTTLKPEDVGMVLAYGKLPSTDSAVEASAESGALPSIRPRIRLSDPLLAVPKEEICYTNVALLSRFVTETGAMLPRRRTGVSALKQRKLANAIKVARQMNLMPYLSKLPQHYDAKP